MFSRSLNFEPINTKQSLTSGDVVTFADAVIAPGVLLQADTGSQIMIRSGVCIGLGSVIHARGGNIVIDDGANLGAGVLLIGTVTIGARACLGAAVTVIDSEVAPGMILEAGTLVGDRSRQATTNEINVNDLINTIPMNSSTIVDPDHTLVASKQNSNITDTWGDFSMLETSQAKAAAVDVFDIEFFNSNKKVEGLDDILGLLSQPITKKEVHDNLPSTPKLTVYN